MYKSVGLSNRQNVKMTLIESFTSGMIGAFIAVVVSYIEIQTIFTVAGPKISMTPELDIMTFVVAGTMGVLVTLIGSIVPIVKSRKMKLVEEIKFE
jgi:ABC-type antimicrobial peptide transport system permease subunit